jgi:hypothetical protein
MKSARIPCWKLPFLAGALLVLADPAAAALKRIIVRERFEVGFPPLIQNLDQRSLRVAQVHVRPMDDSAEQKSTSK